MCKCIEVVNEKLASHNTELSIPIRFSFKGEPSPPQTVMIETQQIETGRGKQKAVGMFPTFCPFCGEKYEAEEASQAA